MKNPITEYAFRIIFIKPLSVLEAAFVRVVNDTQGQRKTPHGLIQEAFK